MLKAQAPFTTQQAKHRPLHRKHALKLDYEAKQLVLNGKQQPKV
jgi:hypothetical protein